MSRRSASHWLALQRRYEVEAHALQVRANAFAKLRMIASAQALQDRADRRLADAEYCAAQALDLQGWSA